MVPYRRKSSNFYWRRASKRRVHGNPLKGHLTTPHRSVPEEHHSFRSIFFLPFLQNKKKEEEKTQRGREPRIPTRLKFLPSEEFAFHPSPLIPPLMS